MDAVALWTGYGTLAALALLAASWLWYEAKIAASAIDLIAFKLIHGRKRGYAWTWREYVGFLPFCCRNWWMLRRDWSWVSDRTIAYPGVATWKGFRRWHVYADAFAALPDQAKE